VFAIPASESVGVLGQLLALAAVLGIAGCRFGDQPRVFPSHEPLAVESTHREPGDSFALMRRALACRRAARHAEFSGDQDCVDRYYESAVFAYFAITKAGDTRGRPATRAIDLYNDSLADALRTAGRFGRIDPRSRWLVNGPRGSMAIPVVQRGFVWSRDDFMRLAEPREARANQYQKVSHRRDGFGAPQVVCRPNPATGPRDHFLPENSFFPATAVLRPDPATWLGPPGSTTSPDVLELYDSYRVHETDLAGNSMALSADPDAAIAMAENSVGGQRYTWTGFLEPSATLETARIGLVEPYRPGKVVVVFVHGLLDNPYIFSDMFADLGSRPGFLDQFQVAVFRYPTGISFLRSASIFRRELSALAETYDPNGTDPGMRNMVLVGYSMGGLLSKLQITSSGHAIWSTASRRPLELLATTDSAKSLFRDMFFFEPRPFVNRVVYIATPHDGSAVATRIVGRIGSRLVNRPDESESILEQIERDNPGVVQPGAQSVPSSIDLLARGGPLLTAMQALPVNPNVKFHTIAGAGHGPPRNPRGDLVVPLASACIPGATSELLVPATHFDVCQSPETIAELERILRQHAAECGVVPDGTSAGMSSGKAEIKPSSF
jgi:pimeloyl-ACP methyl ester carboxylesterase